MLLRICSLFACLVAVLAEVPVWTPCGEVSSEVCNISEIRVTPCKDIKVCKLKKGKESSIQIDFTPNFGGSKVKTGLFWASSNGDIPFPNLYKADACEYTACPLEVGKKQEFDYHLHVSKKLPSGQYELKWKLWNEDDENQACCFKTNVKLH